MKKHILKGYVYSAFLISCYCMHAAVADELYTCIRSSSLGTKEQSFKIGTLTISDDIPMFEENFNQKTIPISFIYYNDGISKLSPRFGNEVLNPETKDNQLDSAEGWFIDTRTPVSVKYTLKRKLLDKYGNSTWDLMFSKTDSNNNTYTAGANLTCTSFKLGPSIKPKDITPVIHH